MSARCPECGMLGQCKLGCSRRPPRKSYVEALEIWRKPVAWICPGCGGEFSAPPHDNKCPRACGYEMKLKHFQDIPPHEREVMARQLALVLCTMAQIDPRRIRHCEINDSGIPGMTSHHIDFSPDLTPAEAQRFRRAALAVSRGFGGRDPIFPGAA